MSTHCDTAAPTRHPPGEAHAAPSALPPTTRLAQVAAPSGYLGGAAARGSINSSRIEEPLSPRDNTTDDAPTPTHPTTSVWCRPKRIRRHHATAPQGSGAFCHWQRSTPTSPPVAKGSRPPPRPHPGGACPIAGSPRWAQPIKDESISFWRLLYQDARVRKSKSPACFSSPFHQKQSRNNGSNAPRPAGSGKTFGPL